MNLLIDTHVFLWYITADSRLPTKFRMAIQDPQNSVYLSVVSIWEAVIKQALGKLPLPADAGDYLPRQRAAHGIESLPLNEGAMPYLASLPPLHRDPFDRILAAQSQQHGLLVVSVDPQLLSYNISALSPT
ncbi:MAG: type II toxin-antitoxin system VapC family toxin [Gemmataceae bacterium]|nr:type II toxin-antitoxin system VapC family toxin [Gemmataceae bacterium]